MSEEFAQKGRQYIARPFYGLWMWVEVCVISLSAAALGFALHPHDPLWITDEFPWVWVAPILIALRYGVLPGIASSLLLLLVWFFLEKENAQHFPKEYFLGGVLLVMLSGQFNIIWEARLMRARQINSYIDERLSQLTHQHHLLILSHQILEQEFFSKPVTLRDAMIRLKLLLNDEQAVGTTEQALLKLLTQYCQLESAAFFISEGQGYKKICEIGSPPELLASDPLLRYSLEQKTLAHLTIQELDENEVHLSPFLIVSPLFLDNGELLGIFAVERLPFFALTTETLQMIAVILEYYADSRNSGTGFQGLRSIFPDIPIEFAQQLSKMTNLQGKFGIESHIVVITLPRNETSMLAASRLDGMRRALDVGWTVTRTESVLVVNLMPLSNAKAVEGYFARIDIWFKEHFAHLNYNLRVIALDKQDPLIELRTIFRDSSND